MNHHLNWEGSRKFSLGIPGISPLLPHEKKRENSEKETGIIRDSYTPISSILALYKGKSSKNYHKSCDLKYIPFESAWSKTYRKPHIKKHSSNQHLSLFGGKSSKNHHKNCDLKYIPFKSAWSETYRKPHIKKQSLNPHSS